MKSIGFKISILIVVLSTLLQAGFGFFRYQEVKSSMEQRLQQDISALAARMQKSIPDTLVNYEQETTAQIVESEMGANFVRAILVKGLVFGEVKLVSAKVRDPEGKIVTVEESPQVEGRIVTAELIPSEGGESVGTVTIHVDDSVVASALNREVVQIAALALALIVSLVVLFSLSINYLVKRPLIQAGHVAECISNGDLNVEIQVSNTDETGQLLGYLKQMQQRLVSVMAEIKNCAEQVQILQNKSVTLLIR